MRGDPGKRSIGSDHVRVLFELPEETKGYPPVRFETLWAVPSPDHDGLLVDNIPFYVRGVSSGDRIRAVKNRRGELAFRGLLEPSGNSTFRLYVSDQRHVQRIRDDLRTLGLPSELSDIPNLIAVEIPAERSIEPFLSYVVTASEAGELEYQEATLRHELPA